ncbi:RAB11-binding protein relch [Clonorchis sinensis]|uniref:RAB11-binding protein relch n=1 Tax=Clonorchis sinensis TaxID=79923 RepID=A0A8T1MUF1_CLOSI|nr:RAB11-binding protein relch [Clonorchis sinensis]
MGELRCDTSASPRSSENGCFKNGLKDSCISAEDVADYLLKEKLHLSALEYYFEWLDRGRRIPTLHRFFSDASCFEQFTSSLKDEAIYGFAHCHSISTLDSIDMGRISDDGNSLEEKLKVLEYELRKKNEELQNLRNELTHITIGHAVSEKLTLNNVDPDNNFHDPPSTQPQDIRPYEFRALAVLINDYLLHNNYRITAVQFSEESESVGLQDVESWEQVGVNLPKPPSLLCLLRSYWSTTSTDAISSSHLVLDSVTDLVGSTRKNPFDNEASSVIMDAEDPKRFRNEELVSLQQQVVLLESKNAQLVIQAQNLRNQLICLEREHAEVVQKRLGFVHQTGTDTKVVESGFSDSNSSDDKSSNVASQTDLEMVHPLCPRSTSTEFKRHMTEILPRLGVVSADSHDVPFRLTTSLDDFVVLVSERLESSFPLMADDGKTICLPLLTQAICLHPDSIVRDRLLRLLFNLFSSPATSSTLSTDSIHIPHSFSSGLRTTATPNGDDLLVDSHQHRTLILSACRRLALYLGPTRLESELLPQLWSQLNERPPPSVAQRLLIVSACGVICPSIPAHLQSSLMLSILESNLDEERNELVRAANVRSLACLVSLMSDYDKLPQLIQRLTRLLFHDRLLAVGPHRVPGSTAHPVDSSCVTTNAEQPTFVTSVEWLLPAVAQWCLELDSLHTTLIDPWLDQLDSYILSTHSDPCSVNPEMVTHTLTILDYLVPFLHAWILITVVEPTRSDQTYWDAAISWSVSHSLDETNSDDISLCKFLEESPQPAESIVNVQLILGQQGYQALQPKFEQALAHHYSDKSTHRTDSSPTIPKKQWTAKSWLYNILLPKLNDILSRIPRQPNKATGSVYNHTDLLETFVSHQYGEYFAHPWGTSAQSNSDLTVCLAVCRFLVTFGADLGIDGIQKLLAIPMQNALMNRSELGNFEYDQQALQTGLLAGYCCLLSSVKAKALTHKVRMLITNAIFLHTREFYPLDPIRLTIWALCLTVDLEYALTELILPALRPCVGCADSMVRRAAATLLHSVIEALRFIQHSQSDCVCLSQTAPRQALIDQLCSMVSQLARDDMTGQRKRINPDEADWSVLAVALGPLHSLLSWCLYLSNSLPRKTFSNGIYVDQTATSDSSSSSGKDLYESEEQLFELIRMQFNLVVGLIDTNAQQSDPASDTDSDYSSQRLLISQQRFWFILTGALLSLADRLLPSCPNAFRDEVILPRLCQLAEMSNSLPNLDQRARLADRLFAVFSTAAYSVQMEESLFLWLVPGLDRVRLDLIEAGDIVRTHEVEQCLSDLYSRIRSDEAGAGSRKQKESGGLRSAVTAHLAKLAIRGTNLKTTSPVQRTTSSVGPESKTLGKNKPSRLSLKKRPQ